MLLNNQRRNHAFLAVMLVLLSLSPAVLAFSLPNPPAPNTTVNGPIGNPPPIGSFTGSVLLQKDQESHPVEAHNDFLAKFECVGGSQIVSKSIKSQFGESIQGPLTNDQTQGIIDAVKSVRPAPSVTLSTTITGDPAKITTWTLTGIKFHETDYNVYVITQASPAVERLVGYIVTWEPEALMTNSTAVPCPAPAPVGTVEIGDGWSHTTGPTPPENPSRSFWDIFTLPDDSFLGIFQYGKVYVYSGGSLVAGTDVRPGENVSLELPPGSYDVSSDVGIFGFHFSISGGHFSSEFPVILYVTLSVTEVVYAIVFVFVVIIIIVVVYLIRRFVFRGKSSGTPGPTENPSPSSPGPAEGPQTGPEGQGGSGEDAPEESVEV